MRLLMPALAVSVLFACGATEFHTRDPYADGGTGGGDDAGIDDAGTGGGGATGGGGGTTGGGSGGGAGGGTTGGGAGGGTTGGGTGGGATGGGTGGGTTGGGTGGGTTGGGTGGGGGTCNATSCATGCCAAGVCVTSTTNAQCGTGGATCQACTMPDTCNSGACDIDPASTWRVRISAMTVRDEWDSGSYPDVEAYLWCPANAADISATMPKVQDDVTPTWGSGGCTVTANELISSQLGYAAIDVDSFGGYEVIAPGTLVPISAADLRAGTKSITHANIPSLTFVFTKL